jgi:hypothetical protein
MSGVFGRTPIANTQVCLFFLSIGIVFGKVQHLSIRAQKITVHTCTRYVNRANGPKVKKTRKSSSFYRQSEALYCVF